MNKSVQIAVLLALIFCAARCQTTLSGMTVWNPRVPDNDASCFMVVQGTITAASYILEQSYHQFPSAPASQIPSQCHFFNFVFDSIFNGETVNSQLNWTNSTDPNNFVINATLNFTDLQAVNGTACVSLPQTQWAGIDQHLCKMKYDTLPVYLAVWSSWNGTFFTFDTNHTTFANWPLALEEDNEPSMQANWLGINASFPNITANLFDSCGSNSNVTSLSSEVTVSTPVNLTANLAAVHLGWTVIKQMGATGNNYTTVVSQSNSTLFDTASNNGCWSMGIHYSDLVPNMSFCNFGCKVSFVLVDFRQRIYVLETTGLWTLFHTDTNNTGNNTGTNNSGNGGTNGFGGAVGTGNSGNTNVSITVSSALSIGINTLFLVLSFVYINWL